MKRDQSKPKKEKAPGANMNEEIKKDILDNKNDLIDGTFCYFLFENGFFDEHSLADLIGKCDVVLKKNAGEDEVTDLLKWLILSIEQCFSSNSDSNDLYIIKNYNTAMEQRWHIEWKPKIMKLINASLNI